jgi:hypothetical protein
MHAGMITDEGGIVTVKLVSGQKIHEISCSLFEQFSTQNSGSLHAQAFFLAQSN